MAKVTCTGGHVSESYANADACGHLQVFSVWQVAVLIVNSFPHAPSTLVDVVDALAVEAGEKPAAAVKSVALNNDTVFPLSDTWNSLENHIYKAKMLDMHSGIETAIAS